MPEPALQAMTAEERSYLERRLGVELRAGRTLVGAHLVLVSVLLGLSAMDPKWAKGAFVVAAFVGVSGLCWLLYAALVFKRIRADLAAGQTAGARVTVTRKGTASTKTALHYNLWLEPPLPSKKLRVTQPVYEMLREGDGVRLRWFPRSKLLAGVERA